MARMDGIGNEVANRCVRRPRTYDSMFKKQSVTEKKTLTDDPPMIDRSTPQSRRHRRMRCTWALSQYPLSGELEEEEKKTSPTEPEGNTLHTKRQDAAIVARVRLRGVPRHGGGRRRDRASMKPL